MADMLRFRKGTYAQINAADKVAGTIYIAKDEKAMYVDVDSSTRIRIGDFIRVTSIGEIPKPYSETAVYYVEDANALLGYKNGEWKQINGTEELASRITSVENRASAVEGRMTTAEGDIDALEGRMTEAEGDIADNAAEIIALKAAVGSGADGLATKVAELTNRMTDAEGDIEALDGTVKGHTQAIADVNAALTEHAEAAEAAYAKKTDVYVKNEVYTKTEADGKISAAVLVETNRAKAAEEANASAAQAASAAAESARQLAASKATIDDVKGLGYVTKVDAEKYTDDAIAAEVSRADKKYATISALEATNGVVSGHTQAINGINETIETLVTKTELENKGYATTSQVATAKQEAIDAAATAAAGIYATKAALEATDGVVAQHTASLTTLTGGANVAGSVAAAKKAADDADAKAVQAGKDAAAAQKTIDDYATAHASDYTNGQIDEKVKAVSDVVAQHTSSLNILTGTGAGSVVEAKMAGDNAQADIDAYVEAHKGDYTNGQIDTAVADAKKAGTDAAAAAAANAGSINSLNNRVGTLETNSATKAELAAAKTELSAAIEKEIEAANAMEYMGGVSESTPLPATAKEGATYVVESAFNGYFPGDLLIATGDEDPDTGLIPASGLTWTWVKTGYNASLEQKIETKDGKIQLSSITGANNGAVSFVAKEGSAAEVTVANNTVTIGMVWEDF